MFGLQFGIASDAKLCFASVLNYLEMFYSINSKGIVNIIMLKQAASLSVPSFELFLKTPGCCRHVAGGFFSFQRSIIFIAKLNVLQGNL